MISTGFILSVVTIIVCFTCFVIFLVAWYRLASVSKTIKADISAIESDSIDESNKAVDTVEIYKATLKGNKYTSEYASDYINIDSISDAYNINLRKINIIPNILTSLGILGTFLGLSIAVAGFDSGSSEGIQNSIKTLLGGMSTAFYTSVAGMLCSLLFIFIERGNINRLMMQLDAFCTTLDKKYHCSADYAVIQSFSFLDEEGNVFSPSETLQAVQEGVKEMRSQLETFGADICDNIGNTMDISFQNKLVPIIHELSVKLENPAQAVTDGLIHELKNVCDDFNKKITQGVNDKMDELMERFIDASNSILTLPDIVDDINKRLGESTKETVLANQFVAETLDNQILRLNELMDSFIKTINGLSDVSNNITELHKNLESLPQTVKDATDALTKSSEQLAEANATTVENIKDVSKNTSSTVIKYVEDIKTIQGGLTGIFAEIQTGLDQYSKAVKESLQDMLSPFTTSVTAATERVGNAIAPLNDAVSDLGRFDDKIRKVLVEIENIFKTIEIDLQQLSDIKQEAIEAVQDIESNTEESK